MSLAAHQVTNVLIDIDGDTAASEAYVTVRLRRQLPNGVAVDVCGSGRYLDRWARRDGVWALDHRSCVKDQTWTIRIEARTPLGGVPGATILESRADRTDLSYSYLGSGGRAA